VFVYLWLNIIWWKQGYDGEKRGRIQYSGPLIPGEGNLDEMLKEHERQILLAVRRAQADKAKRDDNRQAQTLFPANGRWYFGGFIQNEFLRESSATINKLFG